MFLSAQELEVRKVHFNVIFPSGEIDFEPGLRQASPLEAEGSAELLAHTLGEMRVQGRLKVTVESECDRCLELAIHLIESDFDLFYRPASAAKTQHPGEEIEIDDGEAEIAFYEGGGLDLKDVMREHILLSLPMQRICSESCKGICPVCGQNRNKIQCACQQKPADDRWEALKKLTTRGI